MTQCRNLPETRTEALRAWSVPVESDKTYKCGHPRVWENTWNVGLGEGVRCAECRRAINRRHYLKRTSGLVRRYKKEKIARCA